MTRVLRITDSNNTIDFSDPTSGYVLLNHTPAVARREPGNPELYSRVVEEMQISVTGSSRAQITARVDALVEMIDQAQRLWLGENVDPVVYEYQVEDSALGAALQALVTGPPPGEPAVTLPAFYDSAFSARQVGSQGDPLILRFERRGGLLGAEESQTDTNVTAGDVAEVAFASEVDNVSPVALDLQNIAGVAGTELVPRGFIVSGITNSGTVKIEAEAATGSGFATVDETGKRASGTDVATSNAATGQRILSISGLPTTVLRDSRAIAAYAVMRVDAADTTWKVTYKLSFFSAIDAVARPVFFSDTNPTAVYLGVLYNSADGRPVPNFDFERVEGAGTISVDYFVLTRASFPGHNALQLTPGGQILSSTAAEDIVYDHRLLTRRSPTLRLALQSGLNQGLISHQGVPFRMVGDELAIVPMLTGGDDLTYWRYTINGNAEAFDVRVRRRPAYLVPR